MGFYYKKIWVNEDYRRKPKQLTNVSMFGAYILYFALLTEHHGHLDLTGLQNNWGHAKQLKTIGVRPTYLT